MGEGGATLCVWGQICVYGVKATSDLCLGSNGVKYVHLGSRINRVRLTCKCLVSMLYRVTFVPWVKVTWDLICISGVQPN